MKKILVVDDNRNDRELVQRDLEKAGYAVVTAANGRQALARWEALNVQAIVCDLLMPEMDGYVFLQTLRQTNRTLPIIVYTGNYPGFREEMNALKAGASRYVRKPFFAQLLGEVDTLLEGVADEPPAPPGVTPEPEPPPRPGFPAAAG